MTRKAQLVVIGSGPGGYTAAFRAADLGLSVILVERYDVIGADEALTFVIDVQAVIQQPDIADQPSEAGVPESVGATEVV